MDRMKLTPDEQNMLNGKEGPVKQKAMELLVKYGEALGADSFVDTDNVHLLVGTQLCPDILSAHLDVKDIDMFISCSVLDSQERIVVDRLKAFTTCHIFQMDLDRWDLLEATNGRDPENLRDMVVEMMNYCKRIGANLISTCCPYAVGNVPTFGEHCAWTESSAISYANSVLGARTNIEGDHSSFASAITGKTVYCGLHVTENRFGNIIIDVEVQPENVMDWDLLGYFSGYRVGTDIPVYNNIKIIPNMSKLMALSSAGAASGAIVMYHITGFTPEAHTLEQATGLKKPKMKISYTERDRKDTYEKLNCGRDENVEYVALGCPHYSLERLGLVCRLLESKKVSENVKLLIFTTMQHKALAERNGYLDIIEKAGGYMVVDSCPINVKMNPSSVLATDSSKIAHMSGGQRGWDNVWYGSTEDCIQAAVQGKWSGKIE
jgi:predicted aconitase